MGVIFETFSNMSDFRIIPYICIPRSYVHFAETPCPMSFPKPNTSLLRIDTGG